MPVKECDPFKVGSGSCSPSTSHSRRVFEGLSSLLENLKYCRAKHDFQHSLIPLKELRRRAEVWPRHSSSSSSSSSSKEEHRLSKEFRSSRQHHHHRRRPVEFIDHCKLLPNSTKALDLQAARLSHSTDDSDDGFTDLLPVIDELGSDDPDRRRHAAEKVRRLAKSSTRTSMALVKLGAIPPLISMLDGGGAQEESLQLQALLALLNLAVGTNVNKAAIVTAGAVPRLVKLASQESSRLRESIAGVLLSLSALDVNKPVIGHSGAVEALIAILKQGSLRGKKDSLKALYNLSIFHGNVRVIVEAGILQSLLDMVYHPELVETAVDLLGNLAATDSGRRAIVEKQDAVLILVDVLGWGDAPECQEKAVSVLMTMAHRSRALRQAIARSGAVSALLELSMLGSSIARKVANWILDCLQQDDEDLRRLSTSKSSSSGFHEMSLGSEESTPGRFIHKVLQQRGETTMSTSSQRGPNQDISDQFISITF